MHCQVHLVCGFVLVMFLSAGCEHRSAHEVKSEQPEIAQTIVGQREPFATPADGGPALWFLGSLAQVKTTVEDSGGQWGAIVVTGQPGYAPPAHIHHREDESFYVLEGALQFTAGEKDFKAIPGTFVFAPMGIAHSFVVISDEPARWLLIHGPTGDFHRFIQEVGGLAADPIWPPQASLPDPATVRKIALKHYIEPLAPTADVNH